MCAIHGTERILSMKFIKDIYCSNDYICPNCYKRHTLSTGYCSHKCFKESYKKEKEENNVRTSNS